jgi:hypothetical protein
MKEATIRLCSCRNPDRLKEAPICCRQHLVIWRFVTEFDAMTLRALHGWLAVLNRECPATLAADVAPDWPKAEH